jgi:vacuolar protein sorting-associated protein 54
MLTKGLFSILSPFIHMCNTNDSNRMLRDVEYFRTKVGGLDGAGDTGDYIVNLVKEKPVPKAKISTPPPVDTNGKASSETVAEKAIEEKAAEEKDVEEKAVEEKKEEPPAELRNIA